MSRRPLVLTLTATITITSNADSDLSAAFSNVSLAGNDVESQETLITATLTRAPIAHMPTRAGFPEVAELVGQELVNLRESSEHPSFSIKLDDGSCYQIRARGYHTQPVSSTAGESGSSVGGDGKIEIACDEIITSLHNYFDRNNSSWKDRSKGLRVQDAFFAKHVSQLGNGAGESEEGEPAEEKVKEHQVFGFRVGEGQTGYIWATSVSGETIDYHDVFLVRIQDAGAPQSIRGMGRGRGGARWRGRGSY